MRQYDPAIARWTSIDPIVHHSYSTYSAFDNNPVFGADPSGANSESELNSWVAEKNAEWAALGNGANIRDVWGSGNVKSSNRQSESNSTNFEVNINNDRTLKEAHIKLEGKISMKIVGVDTSKSASESLVSLERGIIEELFSSAFLWSPQNGFVLNINGNTGIYEIEAGITIGGIFNFKNVTKIQEGNKTNSSSYFQGPFKLDFSGGGGEF